MKFQVDIELDWVEEDGTIDEAIKDQIISSVESKVISQLAKKLMESATGRIEDQINNICSDAIKAKIDELMTGKRVLTDQFGTVTNPDFSIEKALTGMVSDAMTHKTIDENGRRTSEKYHAKYSLFEWHTAREVPDMVKNAVAAQTKKATETVDAQLRDAEIRIKQLVESRIKESVADKLTKLIMENSSTLALKT